MTLTRVWDVLFCLHGISRKRRDQSSPRPIGFVLSKLLMLMLKLKDLLALFRNTTLREVLLSGAPAASLTRRSRGSAAG